ncbi:uncharacterized protein TNCT_67901 [Trichonephila clavata]|uniref:Uncharacterized protein n=1 Tax=Trichonephila clavata TaxID=2740835 RepID=A0A8X6KVI0_TRICU|nr:uncharacterized protein TNCT_67901 [Trichonephila clavata]
MDLLWLQETVQAGGDSLMVWGVCSWHEMRPLIRPDSTMIGQRIVNLLSDHLHPFISCVHSNGRRHSQRDNLPPPPTDLQKHPSGSGAPSSPL